MTHDLFEPATLEEAAAILRTGNFITVRAPDTYRLPSEEKPAWEKCELLTFKPLDNDLALDVLLRGKVVLYESGHTYCLGVVKQVERGVARISAPHAELQTDVKNVLGFAEASEPRASGSVFQP